MRESGFDRHGNATAILPRVTWRPALAFQCQIPEKHTALVTAGATNSTVTKAGTSCTEFLFGFCLVWNLHSCPESPSWQSFWKKDDDGMFWEVQPWRESVAFCVMDWIAWRKVLGKTGRKTSCHLCLLFILSDKYYEDYKHTDSKSFFYCWQHFQTFKNIMAVDAAVIKATQESLGPFVKKPPLTEKLLGKPFTLTFVKQRYKSLCFKQSYTSLCVKQRHIYAHISIQANLLFASSMTSSPSSSGTPALSQAITFSRNGMEVVVVVVVVVGFNYVDNVFLELVGHRRPEYWLNDDIGIL